MNTNEYNRPLHEYLKEHAKTHPKKSAIIFYGKIITYEELDELSDRFANYLYSQGIRKGDKVALYLPNCPQYIICHFAIQKIGAIVGPCNPMLKEWELEYEVNDLQARAIVVLDHLHHIVDAILSKTQLDMVITTSYGDFLPEEPLPNFPEERFSKNNLNNTLNLSHILEVTPPDCPNVDIEMEDVSLIVYTSGSTGLPKGAMLTYRNALYKTQCVSEVRKYTSSDVSLSVMPICHIAGMLGMNVSIFSGGAIVLLNRFSPEATMEVIQRHHVTVAQTVVPMNVAIMNHPDARKYDFRTLRMNSCTSFGIQLTEEISDRWKGLTGVGLFESAYGLSETHTADTMMHPDAIKFGTTGKPMKGTEIKILSLKEPRQECSVGEEGEIIVRGPGVFRGYLNKPEATAQTLRDGWVYTGDIGKVDEEGYLYFHGRVKEMIKCSGYSVFPEEVEIMLNKHPAVAESAVIGVPDPKRGESVKAFIVLNKEFEKSISPEELVQWSKEKMAAYKYPRYVEFRKSLPMTGTGKLLRRKLKDEETVKTK